MTNNKKKYLTEYIINILPFTRIIFEKFPWLAQILDFSLVGVINAFLSYIIYAFCIKIEIHYQIANQFAYWLTVLNGFILNKFWVFSTQSEKKAHKQMIRYFILYAWNFLLGIILLYVYVEIFKLNKYIVPFLSYPLTIPMNYLINKFWVFKNTSDKQK